MTRLILIGWASVLVLSTSLFGFAQNNSQIASKSNSNQLKILASDSVLSQILLDLFGGQVSVIAVRPPFTDGHRYFPSLEEKQKLEELMFQADFVIVPGFGYQEGWLRPPFELALRGKGKKEIKWLDLGQLLKLQVIQNSTETLQSHSFGNPHWIWNPDYAVLFVKWAKQYFTNAYPSYEEILAKGEAHFIMEFEKRAKLWGPQLTQMRSKSASQYHQTFDYFFKWAGVNATHSFEVAPGLDVLPYDSLVKSIKKAAPAVIVLQETDPLELAKKLSETTGIAYRILPVDTNARLKTYWLILDEWMRLLKQPFLMGLEKRSG